MLNATSNQNDMKLYPLASLFIYSNNQEVTKEKIASVLKELGVSPQLKLAEFFECDVAQMKNMLTSVSSSSGSSASSSNVKEAAKEEAPVEEEEELVEETELNFEDLF
ncbi:uncharacterized protein VNE69_07188 [Vairimorpha necatrix]|uniref:60S acidic ribosomal protein P2 n=1 Tax=Vairimorpha necatrix TaxID=6039 RepID=A0AAX4JDN9_9MICR